MNRCSEKSWLRTASSGLETVCLPSLSPNIIYIADNCFDRFYCDTIRLNNAEVWYDVLPSIQRNYYSTKKPTLFFNSSAINIVVHIRRKDGIAMKDSYYLQVIAELRKRFAKDAIHFWIHTDTELLSSAYYHSDTTIQQGNS